MRRVLIGIATLLPVLAMAQDLSADPVLKEGAPVDGHRPLAQELVASAAPGLSLTLVGKLLLDSPAAAPPAFDPAVQTILAASGAQNVTVGVLDGPLIDVPGTVAYPYPWEAAPAVRAATQTAASLRKQGFSAFLQATGHALDWGIEGLRATADALDKAGLARAGSGNSLGLAAQAGYADEPKGGGRIALVSAATTFRPTSNALDPQGAAPGRPGVSGIELAATRIVSPKQFAALQLIACRFKDPACTAPAPAETVTALGSVFEAGADPARYGTSDFELNVPQADLVLGKIREGKQNADLLLADFHAEQIADGRGEEPPVPDFLRRLAHAAIDAGADIVSVSGRPVLGPIELYKLPDGRAFPIFYGLGNFAWSPGLAPQVPSAARFDGAILRLQAGTIDIYPLDLSSGWPRLADAPRARAILARLQSLSQPYGTTIRTVTDGTGVTGRIIYGKTP